MWDNAQWHFISLSAWEFKITVCFYSLRSFIHSAGSAWRITPSPVQTVWTHTHTHTVYSHFSSCFFPDKMSLLLCFHSLRIAFDDVRSCCSYLFTLTLHVRRLSRLIQNTLNVRMWRGFFSLRRFLRRKHSCALHLHLQSPRSPLKW